MNDYATSPEVQAIIKRRAQEQRARRAAMSPEDLKAAKVWGQTLRRYVGLHAKFHGLNVRELEDAVIMAVEAAESFDPLELVPRVAARLKGEQRRANADPETGLEWLCRRLIGHLWTQWEPNCDRAWLAGELVEAGHWHRHCRFCHFFELKEFNGFWSYP